MSEVDRSKIGPGFAASYHADVQRFFATMDASEVFVGIEDALYERVRYWTNLHSIVLGEGSTYIWSTDHHTYPVSISMQAPVISAECGDVSEINTSFD